ncbi:hypothetical protein DAI22_04g163200 [Oryza sativa Japonica Group]|nr:hypothetical protein DAI22_04g163200 [Oryza sativa Japonica Group]
MAASGQVQCLLPLRVALSPPLPPWPPATMVMPPLLAAAAAMAASGQVRRLLSLRAALPSPWPLATMAPSSSRHRHHGCRCPGPTPPSFPRRPGAVVLWSPATTPSILVAAATSVYREKINERIRIRKRRGLKKIDSGSHHERCPTFRLLSNARRLHLRAGHPPPSSAQPPARLPDDDRPPCVAPRPVRIITIKRRKGICPSEAFKILSGVSCSFQFLGCVA